MTKEDIQELIQELRAEESNPMLRSAGATVVSTRFLARVANVIETLCEPILKDDS